MCILCVIQKWARRVATSLPWLVIPLIGLWALSQLLPAELRFEITSPRLACVLVLLVTLFWYEVLMPRLSAWRVRRYARLKERKRFEAIELEKLRKNATKRCRNCLTPYKDQNPGGGGRFMCSYCGHISKRPVLDLSLPPTVAMSTSGIFSNLVGKNGKLLCGQDWLENGNWVGGSIVGKSNYWWKSGGAIFQGDGNCSTGKSCSGVVSYIHRLMTLFLLSISWLWRKIFRFSSSLDDVSSVDRGMLSKRGDNGTNYQESRIEKARRKAEEKRQARLEKELLEEEEREQREEVARLIEERRKLRDEKMEVGKDENKALQPAIERDGKKEAERKRNDRRKEKDKASIKSNSNAKELEKRSSKDSVANREFDKKKYADLQEQQKSVIETVKMQNLEAGHGQKSTSVSNFSKGNAGSRYFNRMSGFFGKSSTTHVFVTKETRFSSITDHAHSTTYGRDTGTTDRLVRKSNTTVEDKMFSSTVISESEQKMTPKKSWQQLFTRSSSAHSSPNRSVIGRPNSKPQAEVQSPHASAQSSLMQSFSSPINFGLPSPFNLSSFANVSSSPSLGLPPPVESMFPHAVHRPVSPDSIPEVPEIFEDPCYVPDPISLLGPVSESLHNFQLDQGTHPASGMGLERPPVSKNLSTLDGNKPSPIKSPFSQLQNGGEDNHGAGWSTAAPKAENFHTQPLGNMNVNEKGTWQMWNSSPLCQDDLRFLSGPGAESWLFPQENNGTLNEGIFQPSSQKTMASLFAKDEKTHYGLHSPQKGFLGNCQNVGAVNEATFSSNKDPWFQNAYFPPLSSSDNLFSVKSLEKNTQNEALFQNPGHLSTNGPYERPENSQSKVGCPEKGSGEGMVKIFATRPSIGGLIPNTDVQ